MNNNRNERKKVVLALLNQIPQPSYTAKEIADFCFPITISSISTSLRNYCSYGLLKRKRENGIFQYWITTKGIERLEYLTRDNSIEKQIELFVRERIRI